MSAVTQETRERLTYAFGHLVSSFNPEDPHHGDSRDLAGDVLAELLGEGTEGLVAIGVLDVIAEHVAGNYEWTGEAEEFQRRIERGEV